MSTLSLTPQHSQALGDGSLGSMLVVGDCNGNAKAIHSAKPSCASDSAPLSITTSERLPMSNRQMLMSLSDHLLASLSVKPVPSVALPMKDIYSRVSFEPLAFLSPDGSSWSKSQGSFQLMEADHSDNTSVDWSRSGMILSGIAYPLPPLVQCTNGIEFGLWPTPTASDYRGAGSGTKKQRNKKLAYLRDYLHWHWPQARSTYPNPTTLESLMGFPLGHTVLGPSEIPSFRKLPFCSAKRSTQSRDNE